MPLPSTQLQEKSLSDIEYNFWQKWFHRLVLGSRIVSEFSLDLETGLSKIDTAAIEKSRHVFITGLARSGTTILLRRFYHSGHFCCLTYRDMPFVLMPSFWRLLSGNSAKSMEKTERAHGDGIKINYDSPEAFDEVFWKTTCGDKYIMQDHLIAHHPGWKTMLRFKQYIGLILKSRNNGDGKYLSKNNNNILRLGVLCQALPNSLFLVPFRSPLQHGFSLLCQHRQFLNPDDSFTTEYMGFLGHFEFGANHRPFAVSSAANPYDPGTLSYWLFLWNDVYQWLLTNAPEQVVFVSYEYLCTDDSQTWTRLVEMAEMTAKAKDLEPLKLKTHAIEEQPPQALIQACNRTHQLLLNRHQANFS